MRGMQSFKVWGECGVVGKAEELGRGGRNGLQVLQDNAAADSSSLSSARGTDTSLVVTGEGECRRDVGGETR